MEKNRGGTVTEYVPDTLGSVVKTTNSSGGITSTMTYWPYGEINTSSGSNPSPWNFVGTYGYYLDSGQLGSPRYYIRARDYRPDLSRWLTTDPLWPNEASYTYGGSPVLLIDSDGERPCTPGEVGYCRSKCDSMQLKYGDCQVGCVFWFWAAVECICDCPVPPRAEGTALSQGLRFASSKFGKCRFKKTGGETESLICEGGTHQTWAYSCGPKRRAVTVSVTCCYCRTGSGGQSLNCFFTVKP